MSEVVSQNLYRCVELLRFPLGDNKELVYFSDDRVAHVLPRDITRVLDACRTFKTLEDHAQNVCDKLKFGPERAGNVEKLLSDLVQTGMLVTQQELLTECASQAVPMETEPLIATVGIVTCNRSAQLERCLESYIQNCRQHGRDNDFVVMDDSSSAQVRDEHRDKLQSLKQQYGVELRYAGHEEKLAFTDALVSASGLPAEVVRFALFDVFKCGDSIGANRNALLLDTAGDLIFSADDDTVCRLTPHPELNRDLAFFSEIDPTEFWFYSDRDAALEAAPSVDRDLLGLHETMLGRNLGNVLKEVSGPDVQMNEVCPHLYNGLKSGAGTIRVTLNGIVGDSAIPTPAGYLIGLRGKTRERFVQSQADYDSAFASREVMRSVDRPSIYHGTQLMGTVLGIDNRNLLPPFMPVLRNEDGNFGYVLSTCFEHSFFGHLPWAVLHAAENRKYYPDFMKHVADRTFSDVLIFSMAACPPRPGRLSGEERLHRLGAYLSEIGNLALPEFQEFIQLQVSLRISQLLSSLEQLLRKHNGSPAYWARDLRQYIDTTQESLQSKDCIVAQDLRQGRTDSEAVRLSQQLIFEFGRLLQVWPELMAAARTLRRRGVRLAQPV